MLAIGVVWRVVSPGLRSPKMPIYGSFPTF
nr:MAG TPA: hypothetical protein [Caudoviricetes sp.]